MLMLGYLGPEGRTEFFTLCELPVNRDEEVWGFSRWSGTATMVYGGTASYLNDNIPVSSSLPLWRAPISQGDSSVPLPLLSLVKTFLSEIVTFFGDAWL